jgi:phosphatidylserine/phosphatidylglycerophosphate/cardiolipin synthase-like enzyme
LLLGLAQASAQELTLVESFPIETTLDHADIPDAPTVWLEMIGGAQKSLDFAEFYASNEPGSRLETVVQAVEAALGRGVAVRFLSDARFEKTYPETLNRLKEKGAQVRILDYGKIAGGVLHAKYFLVDGRELFLGSQNFDFRALEHIQELGVRLAEPGSVAALGDIFATDWALAGGGDQGFRLAPRPGGYGFPIPIGQAENAARVTLVASPKGHLPDESLWDLPRLTEMIDSAKETVRVQLLTYCAVGHDKSYFETLDSALRRAAARGVNVQMILADWSKRSPTLEGLQSLQVMPGIDVRLTTIPQWSGGFVPFARVSHAKYLVVDGWRSWIGTSNWEGDYFFHSRNVGIIVEGYAVGAKLDRFFASTWSSPYAYDLDPCASYEPPRVAE